MAIIKTAGIFILNNERKLLLAHPTKHPENVWSITKGSIDKGESALAAAIRETKEECNIDFSQEDVTMFELTKVTFKNKRKSIQPYLVMAERNKHIDFDSFDLQCNSTVEPEKGGFPEMDGFRWVTISEAKEYLHEAQLRCLEEVELLISDL